jgi:long-subunit fatty acid transport protein
VGLGIKAMYGMLKADTAIDRSPFSFTDRTDGQYKYRDNTWGYGANVGVIYAPQPGTRIGHIAVEVDTTAIGAQSKTVDAGFKDTWHLSLGAQYRPPSSGCGTSAWPTTAAPSRTAIAAWSCR